MYQSAGLASGGEPPPHLHPAPPSPVPVDQLIFFSTFPLYIYRYFFRSLNQLVATGCVDITERRWSRGFRWWVLRQFAPDISHGSYFT